MCCVQLFVTPTMPLLSVPVSHATLTLTCLHKNLQALAHSLQFCQGGPEFLGRTFAFPLVKLSTDKYEGPTFPALLQWWHIRRGQSPSGELLASFELFQVFIILQFPVAYHCSIVVFNTIFFSHLSALSFSSSGIQYYIYITIII